MPKTGATEPAASASSSRARPSIPPTRNAAPLVVRCMSRTARELVKPVKGVRVHVLPSKWYRARVDTSQTSLELVPAAETRYSFPVLPGTSTG